ncbi:MAG TPA: helix-turn-helix domain-containing protein [Candidatus Hydrogenedentes bacterium]|nr:helix-turn-helix domain-containing protein [Candidatus Hydrogenedentota bacterium]HOL75688.1 helix-turn-helix domain-containing protein [Candidatus Hydrogenedentota bacterium]HPO84319.1 helix-turn-helix domain-containing protein [Candidatus Hydrogenedentota bacterium]
MYLRMGMALIKLDIEDLAIRLTLKAVLEAQGHKIAVQEPDIVITDRSQHAVDCARHHITILLTPYSGVRHAIAAMQQGVYGYILLPLVPGEAEIMVQRALQSTGRISKQEPVSLADAERLHIQRVLRQCKNNRAEAARRLGIGRNTLWRKIKNFESSKSSEEDREQYK